MTTLLLTVFSPNTAIYAVCILVLMIMLAAYPWDDNGTGAGAVTA